ncbi:hypothetical protein GCM10027093_27540 [Paraburkholderia jirisanensis]
MAVIERETTQAHQTKAHKKARAVPRAKGTGSAAAGASDAPAATRTAHTPSTKSRQQPASSEGAARAQAPEVPARELRSFKITLLKDLTRFGDVYRADPAVRIFTIKSGVTADTFGRIARSMDLSKEQLGKTLGLPVTTVDRKVKSGEALTAEQGERLISVARLIGQVQTMVEQSGNPEGFDAAHWLGAWLDEPLPALGGDCPANLMDTAEGRSVVSNLLAMTQSGAYA